MNGCFLYEVNLLKSLPPKTPPFHITLTLFPAKKKDIYINIDYNLWIWGVVWPKFIHYVQKKPILIIKYIHIYLNLTNHRLSMWSCEMKNFSPHKTHRDLLSTLTSRSEFVDAELNDIDVIILKFSLKYFFTNFTPNYLKLKIITSNYFFNQNSAKVKIACHSNITGRITCPNYYYYY